jgi:hypothetical protein
MGGRVGLKGNDDVADEAARPGVVPVANGQAPEALEELRWLVAGSRYPPVAGDMGVGTLAAGGFTMVEVVHTPAGKPPAENTRAAISKFLAAGVDLILFCAGMPPAKTFAPSPGKPRRRRNRARHRRGRDLGEGKWRRNDRRHAARHPSESKRSSFLREINAR